MTMTKTVLGKVRQQVGDIEKIEVLVGIPTFNNAATVGSVVKAVKAGICKVCPHASVLVLNADAGSQDGTLETIKHTMGPDLSTAFIQHLEGGLFSGPISLQALTESGVPGREHAFRAFFTIAEALQAKACVVVDANLRSFTSDWMEVLLHPVIEKGVDYVAPLFRRARYEGSLTNCIIYPLSRALYGKKIRYQSGGGYGFSGKLTSLYLTKNVWEGVGAWYGIDSWLTTVAVAEGCEVSQGFLGARIQDVKLTGIELSVVLAQAVGALFHLMETYQDVWEGRTESISVPQFGFPYEPGPVGGAVNVERMVRAFQQGLRDLLPIWEIILAPETLAGILALGLSEVEEFRFPEALWVQTIYDFALAYHEKALHREHLLKSLTPLYLGQTASLVLRTRDGPSEDVERAIETLCMTFESMKPYLTQRWRFL
ncbi:MAG TPA: glycosyl transferase family 2 [Nitrospiraceae bacterium]|nr:glycosyl transferase family 2 [Nitrospiraceae bacterium]